MNENELRERIEQIIGEQVSVLLEKLGCTGGCIHQEIDASEMIFITTENLLALIKPHPQKPSDTPIQ